MGPAELTNPGIEAEGPTELTNSHLGPSRLQMGTDMWDGAYMDGCMYGWVHVWMDACMDGCMYGWMYVMLYVCMYV